MAADKREPAENRTLVAQYPNIIDFIEHRLKHMRAEFAALGDIASTAIFDDILDMYMSGQIDVTFDAGDAFYSYRGIIEEASDNNDLTEPN